MQPSQLPECDFEYSMGFATCRVCGRHSPSPNGRSRAYCTGQVLKKDLNKASSNLKNKYGEKLKTLSSGSWTGQWNLIQGCAHGSDCDCQEPSDSNPSEGQIYETPCQSPIDYICDYTNGCIRNPYGSWGTTLEQCQSTCGIHFECSYGGCTQSTYFSDIQPWQFATQPLCEQQCIERYNCDYYTGCQSTGWGTSGLTFEECNTCVITQTYCDYFEGCKNAYGIGYPNAEPPPCPSDCKRYFECGFVGCQQSFYFSQYGYEQEQCEAVCLETFYCDNGGGCQGMWSDYFYNPYPDLDSCQSECLDRVYCDFTSGCLQSGKGSTGYLSCEELATSGTCIDRYYCDPSQGCTGQGWGSLNAEQTEYCDASSCISYFTCSPTQGCVEGFYGHDQNAPEGSFSSREECNLSQNCLVPGCTNPNSPSYNPNATCDDGTCVTCCNSRQCVVSDLDDGDNCNDIGGPSKDGHNGSCCDAYCNTALDCSATFESSFSATGCDGSTIVYPSCSECQKSAGGWVRVDGGGLGAMSFQCEYQENCQGSSQCFDTQEECQCDCQGIDDGTRSDEFAQICGFLAPLKKAIIVPGTCQGYYYEYTWCECACSGTPEVYETKISVFDKAACSWVGPNSTFGSCPEPCSE